MRFLFLTFFAVTHLCLTNAAERCHPGHFLHTPQKGPKVCRACSSGFYIPYKNHSNTSCLECTTIKNTTIEKLASECTITKNSVYLCREGYYRMKLPNQQGQGECKRCRTDCKFQKRPCLPDSDAICCDGINYVLGLNNGTLVCLQQCGPGHYIDVGTNKCMTCPEGKYIPDTAHRQRDCYICPKAPDGKVCNSTHGCSSGYFQNEKSECVICQNCSDTNPSGPHVGRPCDQLHDTVCSPRPDMEGDDSLTTVPVSQSPEPHNMTCTGDSSSGLSCGEIAVISVAVIAFIVIIGVIVIWVLKKRANREGWRNYM